MPVLNASSHHTYSDPKIHVSLGHDIVTKEIELEYSFYKSALNPDNEMNHFVEKMRNFVDMQNTNLLIMITKTLYI